MFPINIIGAITGALSGATGGKLSIDTIVDKAISKAAQSSSNDLTKQDAPLVATAVKDALPAPQAMESLAPQWLRYGIAIGAAYIAGKLGGDSKTWEALGFALVALAPPVYRTITTWIARAPVKA